MPPVLSSVSCWMCLIYASSPSAAALPSSCPHLLRTPWLLSSSHSSSSISTLIRTHPSPSPLPHAWPSPLTPPSRAVPLPCVCLQFPTPTPARPADLPSRLAFFVPPCIRFRGLPPASADTSGLSDPLPPRHAAVRMASDRVSVDEIDLAHTIGPRDDDWYRRTRV